MFHLPRPAVCLTSALSHGFQAAVKLKWNHGFADDAMLSTHPVSLRDGSLIVYCDEEVTTTFWHSWSYSTAWIWILHELPRSLVTRLDVIISRFGRRLWFARTARLPRPRLRPRRRRKETAVPRSGQGGGRPRAAADSNRSVPRRSADPEAKLQ